MPEPRGTLDEQNAFYARMEGSIVRSVRGREVPVAIFYKVDADGAHLQKTDTEEWAKVADISGERSRAYRKAMENKRA